jgi:hypothetical protein
MAQCLRTTGAKRQGVRLGTLKDSYNQGKYGFLRRTEKSFQKFVEKGRFRVAPYIESEFIAPLQGAI